ncbi:IclR family transcriptional regulator domain-containing protein [Rhodothalassium salexigens]|uniref:IclR family transcriptional regulator domain-containing protein n=1 Tax=Rhodothalassium salexigens TaxID=1086 RepID=UPI0019137AE3|nr:IclR family transcriptional regulator C-terminal domain-containing protein [Rhodothalassium salexigens]
MATRSPGEISDRDYVSSLARGLEVICAFTRAKPRMTLSEIARSTGMTRATVRRFLLTLVREGYAETDGKYFSLRPKVLELGYSALSSMSFLDVAQPILTRLAEALRESCFLAVLSGHDLVYVARASADRLVNVGISVGSRAPAYGVSTGRVLLAALPEDELHAYLDQVTLAKLTPNTVTSKVKLRSLIEGARRQDYCIIDQEMEEGLAAISVPVRDGQGAVIAALNVCCPTTRITPADMSGRILTELRSASQMITAALQH